MIPINAWLSGLFKKGAEMSNLNPLDGSPVDPLPAQAADQSAPESAALTAAVDPALAATVTESRPILTDSIGAAAQAVSAAPADDAVVKVQAPAGPSDLEKLESLIDKMELATLKDVRAAIAFIRALA